MFFPTIRKVGKKLYELSGDLTFLANENQKIISNCRKDIASLETDIAIAEKARVMAAAFAAAIDSVANPVPKK